MFGWVKHFADGTTERGDDSLVARRAASWSRGRLDSLVRVELHQGTIQATIEGLGEYWQADTYEARIGVNEGVLVQRMICKKLTEDDKFLIHSRPHLHHMKIETTGHVGPYMTPNVDMVKEDQVGQWLIIEMQRGSIKWRIGDR